MLAVSPNCSRRPRYTLTKVFCYGLDGCLTHANAGWRLMEEDVCFIAVP